MTRPCGCGSSTCSRCYKLSCPCAQHQATKSLPHGAVDLHRHEAVGAYLVQHPHAIAYQKKVHPYPPSSS